MEVKASLKHLRISPRKVRLVANLIRGLETEAAISQLKFLNKKAARPVLKLLESAIANATNNYNLDKKNLRIKEIRVEDDKTLRRWLPRAHGRATILRKRMSHVYIVLSEIVSSGKKEAKKVVVEEPVKLEELGKKTKAGAKEDVKTKTKETKRKASSKGFANKVFQRKAG
jgi:large subunit ribosomal protein L22